MRRRGTYYEWTYDPWTWEYDWYPQPWWEAQPPQPQPQQQQPAGWGQWLLQPEWRPRAESTQAISTRSSAQVARSNEHNQILCATAKRIARRFSAKLK